MKKYFVYSLLLFFLIGIIYYNHTNYNEKNYTKINSALKNASYSYLPEEAKEYIKDVYEETGEILLTEKNKVANKPYLNPEYASYLALSAEEREQVELIPEVFTVEYAYEENIFNAVPDTYDLRNINGNSFITPLKNQGTMGICWTFSGVEQAESFLLVSNNTPYSSEAYIFSPRQVDYASSTNGIYNYENENGYRSLGGGGNFQVFSALGANGLLLNLESHMPYNTSYNKKELYEVLNYDNSKFEIDSTIMMPNLSTNYTTAQFNQYINNLKNYVKTYGGAHVGTGSPQGSCGSLNTDNKYIIVDDTVCSTNSHFDNHAMQIIGWDDNYSYSYCVNGTEHLDVNANGTCSSGTLESGVGAWIIRNSWGDDPDYSYIYLSYSSIPKEAGVITSLSSMANRAWDNNYHKNPFAGTMYYANTDSVTLTKNISGDEKLLKVKFLNLSPNARYRISVNTGSNQYNNIVEFQIPMPGIYTVDLASYNILLDNDEFTVSISSYMSTSYLLINSISAFTENISDTPVIATHDVTLNPLYGDYIFFPLYYNTKNIPSNSAVNYSLYKDSTNVSEYLMVENNIIAENNMNPYIAILEDAGCGEFHLIMEYGGESYSSIIEITGIEVVKPDNTVETYRRGYPYNLGVNNLSKPNENGASITFKYQDNNTDDLVLYVTKSYVPSGWLVNDIEKSNNEVITLEENITITAKYNITYTSPVFPLPLRNGYTFNGWYDNYENGEVITSYNGLENTILYANWLESAIITNQITSSILDVYSIENEYRIIIGEEKETTLTSFLEKVDNRENIKIYSKNNEEISSSDYQETFAGTGMKLKLVINEEVLDELIVIVRGDLDGDGRTNTSDLAPLEYHLLEDEERDYIFGFYVYAADFNGDGVANVQDEGILSKYLLEDPSVPSLNN